jgi:hypothetical protein
LEAASSAIAWRRIPSLVCELGAEWVGEHHYRLRQMCRNFGIGLQDHRFNEDLLRNGRVTPADDWDLSPAALKAYERFEKAYSSKSPRQLAHLDRYDWWTWLRKQGYSEDDLRLTDLIDSTDFGESIRHVSALVATEEYFRSNETSECDFKMVGGNSRLCQELARRIGLNSIHLKTPVQEVNQRGSQVYVRSGERRWNADACICTVPTRTLNKIQFDPPLPAAQSLAADQLQYARILKSSVLYSERFWKREDYGLVSDLTSHYYFHSTKNQKGKEGILTSYTIGDKADVLAAQGRPASPRVDNTRPGGGRSACAATRARRLFLCVAARPLYARLLRGLSTRPVDNAAPAFAQTAPASTLCGRTLVGRLARLHGRRCAHRRSRRKTTDRQVSELYNVAQQRFLSGETSVEPILEALLRLSRFIFLTSVAEMPATEDERLMFSTKSVGDSELPRRRHSWVEERGHTQRRGCDALCRNRRIVVTQHIHDSGLPGVKLAHRFSATGTGALQSQRMMSKSRHHQMRTTKSLVPRQHQRSQSSTKTFAE